MGHINAIDLQELRRDELKAVTAKPETATEVKAKAVAVKQEEPAPAPTSEEEKKTEASESGGATTEAAVPSGDGGDVKKEQQQNAVELKPAGKRSSVDAGNTSDGSSPGAAKQIKRQRESETAEADGGTATLHDGRYYEEVFEGKELQITLITGKFMSALPTVQQNNSGKARPGVGDLLYSINGVRVRAPGVNAFKNAKKMLETMKTRPITVGFLRVDETDSKAPSFLEQCLILLEPIIHSADTQVAEERSLQRLWIVRQALEIEDARLAPLLQDCPDVPDSLPPTQTLLFFAAEGDYLSLLLQLVFQIGCGRR